MLSHRIITASGKRVTPQNAANSEERSPEYSIFFNSFYGISRTGRIKSTTGGKSGEIRYWYPLTTPIVKARKKLFIICIRTTETAKFQGKRGNSLTNVQWLEKRKIRANSEYNISICRVIFPPEPERFPDNSLNAIPLDRAA